MKRTTSFPIVCVAVVSSASSWGQEAPAPSSVPAAVRQLPIILLEPASLPSPPKEPLHHAPPAIPAPEAAPASSGSGSTLTGPVTETYGGSSNAFSITNSGSNRGISVSNSATSNASSALYGETYGAGAGLTGFNYGTAGPGGKFEVLNATSAEPAAFATTVGSGPAVLGTVTNKESSSPAIHGQNNAAQATGIGVEGEGSTFGIYGSSSTYGVFGQCDSGDGVFGNTSSGYGVYGTSNTGIGVLGVTDSPTAAAILGQNTTGPAVYGTSTSGYGLYGSSVSGAGVWGFSASDTGVYGSSPVIAVYGFSVSGTGVYAYSTALDGVGAYSPSGPAVKAEGNGEYVAYFNGIVTASAFDMISDRHSKESFIPIDAEKVLDKIAALPVTTWDFKTDELKRRHMGPMAQDFHAAFHLNGNDDKHINLSDLAGVGVAAIQRLHREVIETDEKIARFKVDKDQQIADLQTQLAAFAQRVTQIERGQVAVVQSASVSLPR